MVTYGFHRQRLVGDSGEKLILENWPVPLTKIEGKSKVGDFIEQQTGKIIEVKTDTYPLDRTPNFFMEFHSNLAKKTPGGPWRAFAEGADTFLYFYLNSLTWFEFRNVQELVQRLDELIKRDKLKPMRILNKDWVTTGYKIPRIQIADLADKRVLVLDKSEVRDLGDKS